MCSGSEVCVEGVRCEVCSVQGGLDLSVHIIYSDSTTDGSVLQDQSSEVCAEITTVKPAQRSSQ